MALRKNHQVSVILSEERNPALFDGSKEISPAGRDDDKRVKVRVGKIIFLTCLAALGVLNCSGFPSKYENVDLTKTRPFAIICEPPDASPGDTVRVRFECYTAVDSPQLEWEAVLDGASDLYGQILKEGRVVDLDSLMLPGSTPYDFRFVVPDSILLYNSALNAMLGPQLSRIDSLLKEHRGSPETLPVSMVDFVDQIACRIKLTVNVSAEFELEVFKYLLVRYSRAYGSVNSNRNPEINWVGVVRVEKSNLSDPDSIPSYPHTFQYLYNSLDSALVDDTVLIDTGCSYFVVADSGINGSDSSIQSYRYYSFIDSTFKPGVEELYFDWFYTNLDYTSGMIMDSLILFQSDRSRHIVRMLPPVDTTMHRFKLTTVVRDARIEQALNASGAAYRESTGYFRFSDAYGASRAKPAASARKSTTDSLWSGE